MTVDKHVVARDTNTIVSSWHGHCPDGMSPVGHEFWRFDHHGKVADSTLTGHLDPSSATSVTANLRYPCTSPRNALAIAATRPSPGRNRHV